MALFTLEDLTTPATRADVQASIYRVLATLGVNTTSWGSGSVVRTMVVATSAVLASFSKLQANIARSGFLELSAGDWLTLVARYVYGVERIEATFASGYVKLTNNGGGIFALDADDLILTNPATGHTYRNTQSFTLNAGPGTSVVVPIEATEAGASSTTAAATITAFTTPLLNVVVTNEAVVVGTDAETDTALRLRCREKLGALSPNGPWDAYGYAARTSEKLTGTGSSATRVSTGVTRSRVSKDGYGNVTITVTNATGNLTGSIGDVSTDLGAIDEAIQRLAAPLAVNAIVQPAVAVPVSVSYEAWIYTTAGRTTAEIGALISDALTRYFENQPIGGNTLSPLDTIGKIYQDALRAVIANTLPQIFHVALSSPSGDVSLTGAQVATLGSVSAVIHLVIPAEGSAAA